MKNLRKMFSLMLMIIMTLTLTVTAFAANNNSHTITITNEQAGHTYAAYQVFAGDISDGKLTNIEWGTGVNGPALLTALKNMNASPYASCMTAEDVADILSGFADNSTQLDAFASIAAEHLTATYAQSAESESPYTITVTGDGYYFIKDIGAFDNTDDAATKYILEVVGDVTVEAKADVPDIDKVIVDADAAGGKGTAQDVGSVVNFKVTSKVPAMDGYDTYLYIVHDTMSQGLTFNNDVAVTIDEETFTDYTVDYETNNAGETVIKIDFGDIIDLKDKKGEDIVITYSATINENALMTDKEINKVYLEYSNNPYDEDDHGKTPDKIVYVFDFDIIIDKYTVDGTAKNRLAGAKFILYKTVNEKKLYYYYNETSDKVEWIELDDDAVDTAITARQITEVTTDAKGAAKFQGLDSGVYYLHETEAPVGYNLLKEDVRIEITATYNADGTLASSTATSSNGGQYEQTAEIENKSGTQLPTTGGTGTTIFYIFGSMLVMTAAVLLIIRRRMKMREE